MQVYLYNIWQFITKHMDVFLNTHLLLDISVSSIGGEYLMRFDLKKSFEK